MEEARRNSHTSKETARKEPETEFVHFTQKGGKGLRATARIFFEEEVPFPFLFSALCM